MFQSLTGKIPPHDISAEEAVIGCLMVDGIQIINAGRIQPSDFYHEPLGIAFTACQSLYHRNTAIDMITVSQELDRMGKLETCGGVAYLMHVSTLIGSPLDLPDYSEIVVRLSIQRKAIALGEKIATIGYDGAPDQREMLDNITNLVSDFRKHGGKFSGLVSPHDTADMVNDILTKYQDKKAGIYWGFADLDKITSGIQPGELVLIGGRPSSGKSQLMIDIAEQVELQGKKILIVSAEMSMEQLVERRVAKILKRNVRDLRLGVFSEEDEAIIMKTAANIAETNTYTLPVNVSSQQIYTEALRLQEQVGLDVVFIDYLQILSDCYGDRENQNVRVGRVSKTLKSISHDLGIPVIVPCQLSRAVENRPEDDRLPNLSDLRDSGSLEQDADVVFLLYRYMGNNPVYDGGDCDPSLLRVKMAKNRQLGTAPVQTLFWNNTQRRYVNLSNSTEEML